MSSTPVEQKFTATNPQPFDSLGLFTYLRTYARRHDESDPHSTVESWQECLTRVVNACNSQLNVGFTPDEKQEFFDLLYNLKCSVAGRFLWQLGTRTVDKLGLMSLQNCAFTVIDNPVKPFTWIMNFLMLGAGCGYRISQSDVDKFPVVKHAEIVRRDEKDSDYIVPDSRQGWIKLLGKVMKAHFYSGEGFTYSCHLLRSKGAPIKGFGGLSSGPEVLCDGIAKINTLLNTKAGQKISSVDALDIANIIGMIVVSGNVRRCLPEGALVHTKSGLVPIEKVTTDHLVLTRQGYKPVRNIFLQGEQQLVTIETENGSFSCTPNHRMAVRTDSHPMAWKEAGKLSTGDCLISTSVVTEGVYTQLPLDPTITIPPLDADMAWLIGLFQANGRIEGDKVIVEFFDEDSDFMIMKPYAERVKLQFERFSTRDVDIYDATAKDRVHVVCFSEPLADYFKKHVGFNVPDYILQATPEIRNSYLSGVSDAVNNGKDVVVHRQNGKFVRDVQCLMYSCGVKSFYKEIYSHEGSSYRLSKHDFTMFYVPSETSKVPSETSKLFYSQVLRVREGEERETFDIEVDEVHEFFCNGYLTHNSAQIALGDASDAEYMKAKRWDLGSIPNWRCYSNNSVICNDINEILDNEDFWAGYNGNGEPYGLINLKLSQSCGRLGETQYSDPNVEGYNPCVTADTWVMTEQGPRMVNDLLGLGKVKVYVDGKLYETTDKGFFQTRVAPVYKLSTKEGYTLRATGNHNIMTLSGWVPLENLKKGTHVLIHNHQNLSWNGEGDLGNGFDNGLESIEKITHSKMYCYKIESSSSDFCRGFIKGVFATAGFKSDTLNGVIMFIPSIDLLNTIQRILNRFGIYSAIEVVRCLCLVIKDADAFMQLIGGHTVDYTRVNHPAIATVTHIIPDGIEPVYDCTVPEMGKFDANSFVVSNCAEQSLARWETCCLGEIYLPNISTYEELKKCVTYVYRTCKHSLALPCVDSKETNDIVHQHFRMGIGITGYLQATEEQRNWLKDCYLYLREYDRAYSLIKNFPHSIKLTTCKPSGTLSILGHCTSGVHPGFAQYYIRRIRVSSESKLIGVAKSHGYHVEYVQNFDGSLDYNTQVISFPYALPEGTILAENCTAVQQLEYVKRLQTEWSDNAVSVTVYYRKEELPQIKAWLRENYNNSVKTVSFLLHSDHGFKQAPLEKITKEQYEEIVKATTPITSAGDICYNVDDDKFVGEGECAGGACPLK